MFLYCFKKGDKTSDSSSVTPETVQQLVLMGVNADRAVKVLNECNNCMLKAMQRLLWTKDNRFE